MSKKIWLLLLPSLLFATNVKAEETESPYGLRANLKKAAFELASTEVKNAEEYRDSPNSKLSGDSETMIKGILDFVLEYEQEKYQWNNSIFMEYGETTLKPVDGPDVVNENSDKILFTTDFAQKLWKYKEADLGPFVNIGYQTEFSPNDDAPRTKTFRGKAGLKLFNGKYIKELYAAAVGELDLTYNREDTKAAYELGLKAEYPFKEDVNFEIDTYFRDYLVYSTYEPTDFKYEFGLTSRMMVGLNKSLALGPYIQYLQAKDRSSSNYGSSTIIGITVAYGGLWNL